jgi:ATP-dependent DNA helicase RecQ
MKKEIIITDLSQMHGSNVSIFGFDENKQPVRPVISYTGLKKSHLLDENGKHIIKPFTRVEVDLRFPLPEPPHTEDWEINSNYKPRLLGYLSEDERKIFLESILDDSVKDIFRVDINEGRYIQSADVKRSLGIIKVKEVLNVNYSIKKDGKFEYQISFYDNDGENYHLPVTDCAFRKYCDTQMVQMGKDPDFICNELKEKLKKMNLFLHIDLTRLFDDAYWLQISGVHVFKDYQNQKQVQVDMEQAFGVLKKYFGYTSFISYQEDIIKDILMRNDVFVMMPTGGGKSLCYQIPSLLLNGIVIVVSPLIALMKDQVDGLKANGIAAAYINSSLSFNKIEQIKKQILNNNISILYVAPERLMQTGFLNFLHDPDLSISLIAVDEAHCISEWGHDFRPKYRELRLLKEQFLDTPLIATTATAIPDVQKDIITQLKLDKPKIYTASLNRKNLTYLVKPKNNAYYQLLQYLTDHNKDPGIIYCYSRKSADILADKLQQEGLRALPYHAGLNPDLRARTQEKFIKDDVEIIVATIAFGMGIDKSNVRFVIHYDLPKNLETYYQETGRAGRDGEKSDCILFFSYGDKRKIEFFIDQKKNENEKHIAYQKLHDIITFCDSRTCRRKILLNYFGEEYDESNCGSCDVCLDPKDTIDGTDAAQKIFSCISQINERYGVTYIADVLCGSKGKKITGNKHDLLAIHGTGKEYSKKQWKALVRELVQLGYFRSDGNKYPVLKTTQKIRDALASNEIIILTKPIEEVRVLEESYSEDFDHGLFETLKRLRKKLADEESIPPYIIFHDSSLKAMATQLPESLADLRMINGVGERKLEKYGDQFLQVITGYCREKDIKPGYVSTYVPPRDNTITSTVQKTLELHNQNLTIGEIAEKRNLATSTIASHFEKLILSGEEIDIDKFIDKNKQDIIVNTLAILGDEELSPVKKQLGDEFSYNEIRLVRAYLMSLSEK